MVGLSTIILGFNVLFSCQRSEQLVVLQGTLAQALQEAVEQQKYLFVIATVGNCPSCERYTEQIFNSSVIKRQLADSFLVYTCSKEVSDNDYLFHTFYSVASPTTYVFGPEGTVVNLMSGNKGEDEVLRLISDSRSGDVFPQREHPRMSLYGKELYDFANDVLCARNILADKNSTFSDIEHVVYILESTVSQRSYFYNNYLLAKSWDLLGDRDKASLYAMRALDFMDTYSLLLYEPLIDELKNEFSFDKVFVSNSESLSFQDTVLDLGEVTLRTRPHAVFNFRNNGAGTLQLLHVLGSCSCMDIKYPREAIPVGDTGKIDVVYKADELGIFNKTLVVHSNDEFKPLQRLLIRGEVRP